MSRTARKASQPATAATGVSAQVGASSMPRVAYHLPIFAPGLGDKTPASRVAQTTDPQAPLTDGLKRRIEYLRVSLTDRCNYRCTYCMPEEGVQVLPRPELLNFEELAEVIAALMQVGVRRVRLTGGEPTVRKDLLALVQRLGQLGLTDLAMSTNGERLAELAAPLRQAGLTRLNVSVDTLNPQRFSQVTRRGSLERVLQGLQAARAAGFVHTKLNTVAMHGFNDDELGALCRYAFEHDFTPRFIELMPMSGGALFYPGTFLSAAKIRDTLQREFGPLSPLPTDNSDGDGALPGVGPARYLGVPYRGELRQVGIISAVTEPFCDTCNRVRLSATGQLHGCLAYDDAIDLRSVLRSTVQAPKSGHLQSPAMSDVGASVGSEAPMSVSDPDPLRQQLIDAVRSGLAEKRPAHAFTTQGCGGPAKHMVSIGG